MRIRTVDLIQFAGGKSAEAARLWARVPPEYKALTRGAVSNWGEFLPPLRAHEIVRAYPETADLVVDEVTNLTLREMRAIATAQTSGADA